MRSVLLAASLAFLFSALPLRAAEVEGVKVAERVRQGGDGPELVLNGAGVRTRLFFRVYVGALYLQKKTAGAQAVLADKGPKRVALHLLRELSAEQLFSAMNDGLKSNHSPAELAGFDAQVKALEKIFNAVKVARPGDLILLDLADAGTSVVVHGSAKGNIPGGDFARALLTIWLGEQPADADLKRAMLGS
jgi:hypothetical protein